MQPSPLRRLAALIAAAALACAGAATPVRAQSQAWQVNIAGLPLNCVNWRGQPVLIVVNPYLNNVGVAHALDNGQPVIQLNPNVVGQFSPMVQVWWFAHECGHHALPPAMNSEVNADCWGVRVMRNQGLITHPQQLAAFSWELRNLQGSAMGHLPGPQRAANIINCALT